MSKKIQLKPINSVLDLLSSNTVSNALSTLIADQFGVAVLHIDGKEQNQLVINITNLSRDIININQLSGPASSSNWNINLKLPNNKFYFYIPPVIDPVSGDNWELATDETNGWIQNIYLTNTSAYCMIQPGETIQLVIDYSSIVPDDSRVIDVQAVVQYQNMQTSGGASIHGSTPPQNLDLIADAGRPSPLIGSFIGSASILNDGISKQNLTLQLVNTSQDPIQFIVPPSGDATQSYIEITLPVSDSPDDAFWSLCNTSAFAAIQTNLQGSASEGWIVKADPSAVGVYRLIPDFSKVKNIPPQGVIQLILSGVTSSLRPGVVQVQVSLRRVAIYGTQTFGVALEKTPLIYNENLGSGMTLSGGTLGSDQALTINGDSSSHLVHINQNGTGNAMLIDGGDVTVSNTLNAHNIQVADTVKSGNIDASENINASTANISGSANADSLNVKNELSAGSGVINGFLTLQTLNIGAWTISVDANNNLTFANNGNSVSFNGNTISAANLNVQTVTSSNVNTQELTSASATVNGTLTSQTINAPSIAAGSSLTLNGNQAVSNGVGIWIKSLARNAALNGSNHFGGDCHGYEAAAYWMDMNYPPDSDSNLVINIGNPY